MNVNQKLQRIEEINNSIANYDTKDQMALVEERDQLIDEICRIGPYPEVTKAILNFKTSIKKEFYKFLCFIRLGKYFIEPL